MKRTLMAITGLFIVGGGAAIAQTYTTPSGQSVPYCTEAELAGGPQAITRACMVPEGRDVTSLRAQGFNTETQMMQQQRSYTRSAPVTTTRSAPTRTYMQSAPVTHRSGAYTAPRVIHSQPRYHSAPVQRTYTAPTRHITHAPTRHVTHAPTRHVTHAPVRHATQHAPVTRHVQHAPVQTYHRPVTSHVRTGHTAPVYHHPPQQVHYKTARPTYSYTPPRTVYRHQQHYAPVITRNEGVCRRKIRKVRSHREFNTYEVCYADLAPLYAGRVDKLYSRIRTAARKACDGGHSFSRFHNGSRRACVREAVDTAVRRSGIDPLVGFHLAKTGHANPRVNVGPLRQYYR